MREIIKPLREPNMTAMTTSRAAIISSLSIVTENGLGNL